jgi:RNA polymerase primary sigma factor
MTKEPLDLYLKDIKHIGLLSPEEELKLAKQIKRGDHKARQRMIQSNLRLVISIAKRYSYFGVPISDLIEEGNVGLMKAVSKFNHKKGFRFSTYAAWWIKQYILRAIANQAKTVRIPVYLTETMNRYKKIHQHLAQKLGKKPSAEEMSKHMKLSIEKIHQIQHLVSAQESSLDAPIGEDEESQVADLIEDGSSASPRDTLSNLLRDEKVREVIKKLNPREQEILHARYGINNTTALTLQQLAKKFRITRERVRQIEESAIHKLRNYLKSEKIESL